MSYFICGSTNVDMTVMVTASHLPAEFNGLKITVEDAKPVTGDVLKIIQGIVKEHTYSKESVQGTVSKHSLQKDWIKTFKARHDLSGANLTVVIDPANMIGALEIDTFKAFEPNLKVFSIFDNFDHTCPNHEANPLKYETLVSLAKEVQCQKADIGIAFDGDADRVGFVDENGVPAPADLVGALIAKYILEKHPGATIACDIRSSRVVREEIERAGGKAVFSKVGHTHVRSLMRKTNALFGSELSGHFFFRDSYFSEGGPLPAFIILEIIKKTGKKLSELIAGVRKYYQSGEINSHVTRTPAQIYEELKTKYPEAEKDEMDGLTLITKNWWCNLRPSANDPVMRLNLEACDLETMEVVRDELLATIRA
jgi:phosphomannomutase